jgi:hypothetical protein
MMRRRFEALSVAATFGGWKRGDSVFRHLSFAAILGFAAVATWQILDRMSMDALAMAMGIVLGIGAGLPVALLMLAAERRHSRGRGYDRSGAAWGERAQYGGYGQQPPVIVVTPGRLGDQGSYLPPTSHQAGIPFNHPDRQRRFVVVGQGDEEVEEW